MISKTIVALSLVALAFCTTQVISVECPPPDENPNPVYLADPTNCSRYYICSNGIPILLDCPFPLVWDPTANSCNSPGLYHCEPTTTAAPPSTTTEETTDTDLTTTPEEELSTTEVPTTPAEELSTPGLPRNHKYIN